MSADVIDYRLRAGAATAEIVALADRVLTGVAAYIAAAKGVANFCDDPECQRVFEAYWSAWEELVASPPRNAADIVQTLRAGEAIYAGSDTTTFCELLWEDCRLLLAKSG